MPELLLLDDIDIDTDMPGHADIAWHREAHQALLEFCSTRGGQQFTAADFHRWAAYYLDLPDPELAAEWGHVFQNASRNGKIKCAGIDDNGKKRWVST